MSAFPYIIQKLHKLYHVCSLSFCVKMIQNLPSKSKCVSVPGSFSYASKIPKMIYDMAMCPCVSLCLWLKIIKSHARPWHVRFWLAWRGNDPNVKRTHAMCFLSLFLLSQRTPKLEWEYRDVSLSLWLKIIKNYPDQHAMCVSGSSVAGTLKRQ
jgi:hypothetical protein